MASHRLLLLAPGAGAPSSSAWMQRMKRRLERFGRVVCFDYPYQIAGRRSPDKQAVLVEAHRRALEEARRDHEGPVVLAGKSMGGRMGCHVAATSRSPVAALVCLGYPLVGRKGDLRDQILLELETPVLFVQGTRDPLCPLDRLSEVLPRLKAPHELYRVEDGDHSLVVGRARLRERGETQDDVDERTTAAIGRFLETWS